MGFKGWKAYYDTVDVIIDKNPNVQ